MTTFRYVALAVLAVLAAGYAYYWMTLSRPATPATPKPVAVVAWVLPDGAIRIDGQRISDPETLKAKLAEFRKAGTEPEVHLRAPQNMKFETIGKAVTLLQKSGVASVGFITEPRNVTEDDKKP